MVSLAAEVDPVVGGDDGDDDGGGGGCRRVLLRVPRVPRVGGTSRRPLEELVRVVVGVPGELLGDDDAVEVDLDDGANAGACS